MALSSFLRPRRTLLSWPVSRILVAVLALAGLGTLLYPSAASWLSDRAQAGQVDAYVHAIESLSPGETRAALRKAHRFNQTVPEGAPHDPYATGPEGEQTATGSEARRYFHTLDLGPEGMMGVLSFPAIHVQLPIFHGTAPATLDRGLGHLFGSALPVGGPGTHSVITGHSGLIHATLFTHLDQARRGERFTITVLDQVLTYQVDRISRVLPTELDHLKAVPGKDFVTLVTCTPTGVNTHRLLVRGHRIPTPGQAPASSVITGARPDLFPWWILWAALGFLATVVGTTPLARKPVRRVAHELAA
ncbi:hypothetical protein GCM10022237_44210 [Nocardioides ginsengisoli]|uniref:Class C sortase n=1 Tax=Nocardioides ginsengisoli TaxID=363868 RepID=A0ABW3VWN3_9ACTN